MSEINCNNCAISDFKESLCKRCDKMKRIGSADDIEKLIIGCLPSEQPEWKWIPCSERLPEDFEEVNVTWINTDPEPYYDFVKGKPFTGTAVYYKGRWFWYSAVCTDYLREYGSSPNDLMDDSIKVVAWQPLPEPYEEGKA